MSNYSNVDGDSSVELENIEIAISDLSSQLSALQVALTSDSDVAIASQLPHTINAGHNMFGYTGSNGIPIEEAFITATGNPNIGEQISIVKNQAGTFWMPNVYAGLSTMANGGGYYLYNTGNAFSVTWI
jgi:hypothetical protein